MSEGTVGKISRYGDTRDRYLEILSPMFFSGDPLSHDNPDRHRFEIDLGDGSFALAEYMLPLGKIRFTHTQIPEGVG